jgi:energy-coupling factor transport system substrate-specific component
LARKVAFAAAAAGMLAAAWAALDPDRGALALFLAAGAVLVAAAAWLESGRGSVKDVTLVATLGGLAAAGRVLFAPVPQVQPVTVIVVATGVALAPLVSNVFLGQGPHTPWQMLAWGGCGALAGLLRGVLRRRSAFVAFCFALGFAYGIVLDFWVWYGFYPHTTASLLVRLGAGVPFNAAHAIGNLAIALAAGPELRRVLERFGRRLRTEVVWT